MWRRALQRVFSSQTVTTASTLPVSLVYKDAAWTAIPSAPEEALALPLGHRYIHPAYPKPRQVALLENPFDKPILCYARHFDSLSPLRCVTLSRRVYGAPVRLDLMHLAVRWQRDMMRVGLATTKDKSQVRGSRRKLYKQKGSGRARMGSNRTPARRGGGRAFAKSQKDWSWHLPVKMREAALRSALSAKFHANQMMLIESQTLNLPSGESMLQWLSRHQWRFPLQRILLIDTLPLQEHLAKECLSIDSLGLSRREQCKRLKRDPTIAKRRSYRFAARTVNEVSVMDLVLARQVFMTVRAAWWFETKLGGRDALKTLLSRHTL